MQKQAGRFRRLVPRTLRFDVAQSIKTAILEGQLTPGSPLVEARLAEEMGISRAPVREALRALEEEGLVASIPYKGTCVAQITPDAMAEIIPLRTVLEGFATELALPRLRTEGIQRMRELLAEMRAAAAAGKAGQLVELHLHFHRTLYEVAGQALLLQFWKIMEGQLRLYLLLNQRLFASLDGVVEAHEETIRILETGSLEEIKIHLAEHIARYADELIHPQPEGIELPHPQD